MITTSEQTYTYRVTAEQYIDEDGTVIPVYGIEVLSDKDGALICSAENLFTLRTQADELAELCNALQLDPHHFADVIEDALIK